MRARNGGRDAKPEEFGAWFRNGTLPTATTLEDKWTPPNHGEPAVLEDLEELVEDPSVGLLDLVEQ